ncbi:hypothetical protein MUCCIDRAFT_85379 [Mucor lusitanicus CBS 277.49]|uniref:Uncharacterized protein n=1 Tax=Mucor lusitanicus CBS 277.49 TaxID=747725 RepID=A0A168HIP0_MUCCL|nr:hypothetical protein MUCCIDRAFT_85379 [Mucor lusitanicus CBS 277.49]
MLTGRIQVALIDMVVEHCTICCSLLQHFNEIVQDNRLRAPLPRQLGSRRSIETLARFSKCSNPKLVQQLAGSSSLKHRPEIKYCVSSDQSEDVDFVSRYTEYNYKSWMF